MARKHPKHEPPNKPHRTDPPQRPAASGQPPRRPRPCLLDDRIWDVFRLDEDDSPDEPPYGDFWPERDDEGEEWPR